jgi:hypothetical protein
VAAIVLMKLGQLEPVATNPVSPWSGLLQRVLLITYFGWIFTFALVFYRRTKKSKFD